MNTFLPFPDFAQSAQSIDNLRLNKQRIEIVQMLDALHEIPKSEGGWAPPSVRNHPVTRMWEGHELQLITFAWACNAEWLDRGRNSGGSVEAKLDQHFSWAAEGSMDMPFWFGDPDFHAMMQSVLLRKDPDYYGPLFPGADPGIEQYYPTPS